MDQIKLNSYSTGSNVKAKVYECETREELVIRAISLFTKLKDRGITVIFLPSSITKIVGKDSVAIFYYVSSNRTENEVGYCMIFKLKEVDKDTTDTLEEDGEVNND